MNAWEAATMGVVADGSLQLSERLELPDQTPVLITVRPMAVTAQAASAAWEATKQRLAIRPIEGPGRRFTRDDCMNAIDTNVLVYAFDANERHFSRTRL